MQGGDVGVATERLGVVGDQLEVEVGDQLHRPEPAGEALDHVDLGVGEHRLQVAGLGLGVAGDIGVAGLDAAGQLHPVAAGLPPLDPAQQVGPVLEGLAGAGTPMQPPSGSRRPNLVASITAASCHSRRPGRRGDGW